MIRTKGEAGTGDIVEAVRHMRAVWDGIRKLQNMPDDELMDAAARGTLKDPAVLGQQVRRMMADRRSVRFLDDFAGQWLTIRNIHSQDPDQTLFAGFDPTLREAMARETELFFESQVREDRPIPELLTANYTFLN